MKKKIFNYLVAAIVIFLVVLMVGVLWVHLKWSESAMLAVFLTVIGVGAYWWRVEGLG
jgi:hypothetical protein